ncbi:hypothetical protein [Reinekea sp. G2M2-21]|uniref:hypothetical protein n=1 Tax=Reinekea sp. G2M2-21 TaxID=2788942 RepID=UPI0018AB803A|nr:hypothetical protein [Reinekea sp. G2M2-21]
MKLLHWTVVAICAGPLAAHAFETRLNGFISVGGGMTLSEGQEYVTDPVNFGQYTNELSIKPDTMVAIQTSSQVNDRLSATAQLVGFAGAKQFVKFANADITVDRGFDVNFEWAYVNYELLDSVDLKVGRIRMPVFYYSSSLDLGYSYNWIRPPAEVYNLFTTSLEGMSVDYDISIGDWYGTATGYYGETSGVDPETQSIVEFESILGGIIALERGSLTLRGSYSVDDNVSIVRTFYNPLVAGYVTQEFELPLTFASGSAIYDNGTVMLGSEVTSTKFKNNLNNDESAWYVTGGVRLGSFTPHVTYSSFKQKSTAADTSLVFIPGQAGIKVSDYPQDISAITAGVRWDFDIAAAIKVEYTNRTDNTAEPAILEGLWSPFGDAQVLSVSVDVVF